MGDPCWNVAEERQCDAHTHGGWVATTSSGVVDKSLMEAVTWLPTVGDGRCFWDAVSQVTDRGGPDETKHYALQVSDANVHELVVKYGGSASNWRAKIQGHRVCRYQYADHYAIAPAAANLKLLLVIWNKEDGTGWVYKPGSYERVVLLKLEWSHFEVSNPDSVPLSMLEDLIASCKETWEKCCPLLRGGGKRATKKPGMSKADIALEAPATVQQWDEGDVPTGDTWSATFLNVTSLRLHIDQAFALPAPITVLVETRVWGAQYESICNRCHKQGYELVAAPSVRSDCDGHNGIFVMVKR
eukprot:496414-Amphidinium_carterae.1